MTLIQIKDNEWIVDTVGFFACVTFKFGGNLYKRTRNSNIDTGWYKHAEPALTIL